MKRTLLFVTAAILLLVALSLRVSGSIPSVLAQGPALNVVQTDAGQIAPARDSTADICIFEVIPFAAPPVGALRWKPPQPVTPWQGVRRADNFGPWCIGSSQAPAGTELDYGAQVFSEDCLH